MDVRGPLAPLPLHPEIRPCIICMITNKLKLPTDKLCGYSSEDLKQKLAIALWFNCLS